MTGWAAEHLAEWRASANGDVGGPGGRRGARRRLWAGAVAASVLAHVLVLVALAWAPKERLGGRAGAAGPFGSAITVGLTSLPEAARVAAAPNPAPGYLPAAAPQTPSSPKAAPQDGTSGVGSAGAGPGDDDGIYRVPFRDAVAQAYASLRGGLGCAHVDLDRLPASVRDLCLAGSKLGIASDPDTAGPADQERASVEDSLRRICDAAHDATLAAGGRPARRLDLPLPLSLCNPDEPSRRQGAKP